MNSYETLGEYIRWELNNVTVFFKSPKQHPKNNNQVKWARQAGHCWWSKDELISDVALWTPTHGHTSVSWSAKTYILQLCGDTWYRTYQERLMMMCVCERERERENNPRHQQVLMMMLMMKRRRRINQGGARGIRFIIVKNGLVDTSSEPGRDSLQLTKSWYPSERHESNYSPWSYG